MGYVLYQAIKGSVQLCFLTPSILIGWKVWRADGAIIAAGLLTLLMCLGSAYQAVGGLPSQADAALVVASICVGTVFGLIYWMRKSIVQLSWASGRKRPLLSTAFISLAAYSLCMVLIAFVMGTVASADDAPFLVWTTIFFLALVFLLLRQSRATARVIAPRNFLVSPVVDPDLAESRALGCDGPAPAVGGGTGPDSCAIASGELPFARMDEGLWARAMASRTKRALIAFSAALLFLFVAVIFAGIGRGAADQIITSTETSQGNSQVVLQDTLENFARIIDGQAPVQIDADTILTSVSAVGDELTYKFSVDHEVDFSQRQQLQEAQTKEICSNDQIQSLIQSGAILNYAYTTPSGEEFMVSVRSCT